MSDTKKYEVIREQFNEIVMAGEETAGVELARSALDDGFQPIEFFQQIISPVVAEVGDRFSRLEIFLPELMRAGKVVKAIQEQVLEPVILETGVAHEKEGKVVIGTSQGDIHDIGKNMVSLMLQVNGFEVVDLGTNISPRQFIDAAKREHADIIATSTLLTTSLPFIKDIIELLQGFGLRDQFSVVAGGAAVTQQWVDKVGVDGYGRDATDASQVCRTVIKNRKDN